MNTYGLTEIPQWLEPWIGGVLLIAALAAIAFAFRFALKRNGTPRVRWGNAIGTAGAALFFAGMGLALVFQIDFFRGPIALTVTGFIAAGVGGTMATWQRN